MNPGQLDRKVILQSMTETRDSLGDVIQTWTTYATPWARRIGSTGKEATENVDQKKNVKPVKWRVRYDDRIGVADRLIYLGTVHDIQDVAEIGREHMMELDTIARDNEVFNLFPEKLYLSGSGTDADGTTVTKISDLNSRARWQWSDNDTLESITVAWDGSKWAVAASLNSGSLAFNGTVDVESPLLITQWDSPYPDLILSSL